MKVLILSDGNSVHTIKWVKALAEKGVKVGLWSISSPKKDVYKNVPNLVIGSANVESSRKNFFKKIKYLSAYFSLRKFVAEFQPNIVHAHYASSYGLLGTILDFHPFVISVWGADVYEFPYKNVIFDKIIRRNLRCADIVLSTSKVMAEQTKKFTDKHIMVTPFGVDTNFFKKYDQVINRSDFCIGTVKTLEKKYGIEYLIKAFHLLKTKYPDRNLKLLVVGGGSLLNSLKQLTVDLKIKEDCEFVGPVPFEEVPYYHNLMDISACLSISDSESFGVSAVEAAACERPVVVSDVAGLAEVVVNEETGLIVPRKNFKAAAKAFERLLIDQQLREELGKGGRIRVQKHYSWLKNVQQMINIYESILLDRVE
ncbi:glycosyltransferase [Olivibacter sp. SA151]|uniref:glycosyltransferase n=1 Tax=Olivibacter jilunii TaxID=985016 RepID=UPI003F16324C